MGVSAAALGGQGVCNTRSHGFLENCDVIERFFYLMRKTCGGVHGFQGGSVFSPHVRSSPMAHPAERPLPKLPLVPLRPETRTTPQFNYLSGQNATEHNPAPSPSGHPLLSGPPT